MVVVVFVGIEHLRQDEAAFCPAHVVGGEVQGGDAIGVVVCRQGDSDAVVGNRLVGFGGVALYHGGEADGVGEAVDMGVEEERNQRVGVIVFPVRVNLPTTNNVIRLGTEFDGDGVALIGDAVDGVSVLPNGHERTEIEAAEGVGERDEGKAVGVGIFSVIVFPLHHDRDVGDGLACFNIHHKTLAVGLGDGFDGGRLAGECVVVDRRQAAVGDVESGREGHFGDNHGVVACRE